MTRAATTLTPTASSYGWRLGQQRRHGQGRKLAWRFGLAQLPILLAWAILATAPVGIGCAILAAVFSCVSLKRGVPAQLTRQRLTGIGAVMGLAFALVIIDSPFDRAGMIWLSMVSSGALARLLFGWIRKPLLACAAA